MNSTGYAAAGVVRQRTVQAAPMKIVDMSRQLEEKDDDDKSKLNAKKEKKEKEKVKESKKRRSSHRNDEGKEDKPHDSFNPFLQTLALSLSNKTMSFSFANE